MTNSTRISCEQALRLIADYLDGELSEIEQYDVRQHLEAPRAASGGYQPGLSPEGVRVSLLTRVNWYNYLDRKDTLTDRCTTTAIYVQ